MRRRRPSRAPAAVDLGDDLEDRIFAGWLCQIIGGAYGTCMEGYITDNIMKAYRDLRRYVREPNTYNDDITYELALLCAYEKNGKETGGKDIAYEWLARLDFGWSAEDMACGTCAAGSCRRRADGSTIHGASGSARRCGARSWASSIRAIPGPPPGGVAGRGDLPLSQRDPGGGVQRRPLLDGVL